MMLIIFNHEYINQYKKVHIKTQRSWREELEKGFRRDMTLFPFSFLSSPYSLCLRVLREILSSPSSLLPIL